METHLKIWANADEWSCDFFSFFTFILVEEVGWWWWCQCYANENVSNDKYWMEIIKSMLCWILNKFFRSEFQSQCHINQGTYCVPFCIHTHSLSHKMDCYRQKSNYTQQILSRFLPLMNIICKKLNWLEKQILIWCWWNDAEKAYLLFETTTTITARRKKMENY